MTGHVTAMISVCITAAKIFDRSVATVNIVALVIPLVALLMTLLGCVT
jgi:hypothetical protein